MIEIRHRTTFVVLKTIDADNLSEADLYGANLRGADLYGANLRGANLYRADLCGANLYRADLCGANLCEADLSGANLCGANLCEADLSGANLCGADLYGANLRGANLYGANLSGANLRWANNIVSFGPVGNEGRIGYAVQHEDGPMVQLGCFWGTLDEACAAIRAKYGDDSAYERLVRAACDCFWRVRSDRQRQVIQSEI